MQLLFTMLPRKRLVQKCSLIPCICVTRGARWGVHCMHLSSWMFIFGQLCYIWTLPECAFWTCASYYCAMIALMFAEVWNPLTSNICVGSMHSNFAVFLSLMNFFIGCEVFGWYDWYYEDYALWETNLSREDLCYSGIYTSIIMIVSVVKLYQGVVLVGVIQY